jgi:hypothetical protein
MPLCTKCNDIDIRAMLAQASPYFYRSPKFVNGDFYRDAISYKLHDSVLHAMQAKDTCDFCAFVWKVWCTRAHNQLDTPPSVHLRIDEDRMASLSPRLWITWNDSRSYRESIKLELFRTIDGMAVE